MELGTTLKALTLTGTAIIMMAANASAVSITYTDAVVGTGFNGTNNLSITSTNGLATLSFATNGETINTTSNANYGTFNLSCPLCSPAANFAGAFFNAFTFSLKISDVTDNATGIFLGSAAAGTVFSDQSPLTLTWVPAQLGTGTSNASSGNFGSTSFTINQTTRIVCPTCGNTLGQTSVQGTVASASAVPEPATFGMVGAALLGLGLVRRKQLARA